MEMSYGFVLSMQERKNMRRIVDIILPMNADMKNVCHTAHFYWFSESLNRIIIIWTRLDFPQQNKINNQTLPITSMVEG